MTSLRPGQLVACIDDDFTNHPNWAHVPNKPVKGVVYTIRENVDVGGEYAPCVRLVEVVNRPRRWSVNFLIADFEAAFEVIRFRPLVKSEFDLSVFTEILTRQKEGAPT